MRRRWRYQWGWGWLKAAAALWFIGALPEVLILSVAAPDKQGDIRAGVRNVWAIAWGTPLVIGGLVLLAIGLGRAAVWLWHHPPIRRQWEHSPDLREVHRD